MLSRLETKIIHTIDDCTLFAERDLFNITRNRIGIETDILCIDYFEVQKEHRNKGYGKEFLKNFCKKNKENYILFLMAGFPITEEEQEPSKEELSLKLSKLEKFYTSIGFLNVNEKIGQYEQKISFLYNGGIGEKIITKLTD